MRGRTGRPCPFAFAFGGACDEAGIAGAPLAWSSLQGSSLSGASQEPASMLAMTAVQTTDARKSASGQAAAENELRCEIKCYMPTAFAYMLAFLQHPVPMSPWHHYTIRLKVALWPPQHTEQKENLPKAC